MQKAVHARVYIDEFLIILTAKIFTDDPPVF